MGLLLGTKRGLLAGYPATRYYVDATLGNDANDGKTPDRAWQTIGKVNAEAFNPGESILFKRGETWRETLTAPSSGKSGAGIIFGIYGSGAAPIINGADIITGWADYVAGAGSTWESALATECNQVFMDDVRLTEGSVDEDNLADHEWFWVGNVLYVRDDTGDPDGSGVVIEASVRSYCIDIPNTTDFIILDNIHTTNSNTVNIRMKGNGFIIRDSLSDYAYSDCIAVSAPSTDVSLGLIDNCEIAYSSVESGIYVGGVDPGPSNVIIENCEVHHNGTTNGDNGIYFSAAHNCVARYNLLHDNGGNGIQFQHGSDDNECYYNLVYDNGLDGIWIGTVAAGEDNNIYNNVVFNNASVGINVGTNAAGNVIENNIVFQDSAVVGDWQPCIQFASAAVRQAQTWNYNCVFYDGQAGNAYHDDDTDTYYNLAGFQGLAGSPGANSIASDPVFVNEGIPDFHLQVGSLCRDAGTDVGLTGDYDGVSVPQETNPAIGAYEYVA